MERALCRSPAMILCLSEMCSLAPPLAHTDSPVPRPWSKEARERVYFFHSDGVLEYYTQTRRAHQKEQEAIFGEAKVNQTFRRLVQDGMTFDELGLDLTLLQHVRHRSSPEAVLQDEDVKLAVNMLVVARTARGVHLPSYAHALWQLDQPARRPACDLTAAELAAGGGVRLASFLAHGVVQIETVAEFGVDVAALSAQGIDALEHHGDCTTVKGPALAVPQLGSCASSARAWRLRAARHSQGEAPPPGAQPPPRGLERAASKVADAHRL